MSSSSREVRVGSWLYFCFSLSVSCGIWHMHIFWLARLWFLIDPKDNYPMSMMSREEKKTCKLMYRMDTVLMSCICFSYQNRNSLHTHLSSALLLFTQVYTSVATAAALFACETLGHRWLFTCVDQARCLDNRLISRVASEYLQLPSPLSLSFSHRNEPRITSIYHLDLLF